MLLFEIPGVSNAKAVRFLFCFYLQIRIAWHVRASSPAVPGSWSRLVIRTKVFFVTVRQTIVKHQKHRHSQGEMASTAEKTAHKRSVIAFNIDRQRDGRGRGGLTMIHRYEELSRHALATDWLSVPRSVRLRSNRTFGHF